MSVPGDVLAAIDAAARDLDGRLWQGLTEARAAVAEQQALLRKLVDWNRNPNGDGRELAEICAGAELLVGRGQANNSPRHGEQQIAAVAELVEADREYDEARRDWDYAIADPEAYSGEEMARVANRFESAIARRAAALAKFGGGA